MTSFLGLHFPASVGFILLLLFGVLTAGTLYIQTIRLFKRNDTFDEVWIRIRTWWVIIPIFTIMLGLSDRIGVMPYLFFGFVSFIALKEYLSITPSRHIDRNVFLAAYLVLPLQYFFAAYGEYQGLFQMGLLVYVMPGIVILMLINQRVDGFMKTSATLLFGLSITVYSISHLARLFTLPAEANPVAGPMGLVVFVVLLTQGNDVAQFVSGKTFGKRKIVPKVSPNKTWEGFIGGALITSIVAVLIAPYLTPFSSLGALGMGLMIGVSGFFGDVFVSALKRDMGVKDASQFLPGHGGMLDRVDSLTITAPLFFHLTYYFVFMKGGWV